MTITVAGCGGARATESPRQSVGFAFTSHVASGSPAGVQISAPSARAQQNIEGVLLSVESPTLRAVDEMQGLPDGFQTNPAIGATGDHSGKPLFGAGYCAATRSGESGSLLPT
jgi:hypothetical protein